MDYKNFGHDNLVVDLARFFQRDRIVIVSPTLGTTWRTNATHCVPDVLTFNKSYARPVPTIYEVKSNRADFLQDSQSGKFLKYQELCQRFYFAVPRGLVKSDEVPVGAGLIVRNEKGWRVYRSCRLNDWKGYDLPTIQALLMRGMFSDIKLRALRERDFANENKELSSRARQFPYTVYAALRELELLKEKIRNSETGMISNHAVNALSKILKMPPEKLLQMSQYRIEDAIKERFEKRIKKAKSILHIGMGFLEGTGYGMRIATDELKRLLTPPKFTRKDKQNGFNGN